MIDNVAGGNLTLNFEVEIIEIKDGA